MQSEYIQFLRSRIRETNMQLDATSKRDPKRNGLYARRRTLQNALENNNCANMVIDMMRDKEYGTW